MAPVCGYAQTKKHPKARRPPATLFSIIAKEDLMALAHRAISVALLLTLFLCAPLSAQGWGTVKGQVVLAGKGKFKQEFHEVDKNKAHCLSRGPIPKDALLVNTRNRGVRWAIIWLARDDKGKADHNGQLPIHPRLRQLAAKEVALDTSCCRFEPHVVTLRVGQDLVIRNSSLVPHAIRLFGNRENVAVNVVRLLPPQRGELKLVSARWKPYLLPSRVTCAIHDWMSAWVFVFRHPYFAVTDANGHFEIKDAPAGKYRLIGWQERSGWFLGQDRGDRNGRSITIEANKVTDLGKIELHADQ
jgi:hypothetical protein